MIKDIKYQNNIIKWYYWYLNRYVRISYLPPSNKHLYQHLMICGYLASSIMASENQRNNSRKLGRLSCLGSTKTSTKVVDLQNQGKRRINHENCQKTWGDKLGSHWVEFLIAICVTVASDPKWFWRDISSRLVIENPARCKSCMRLWLQSCEQDLLISPHLPPHKTLKKHLQGQAFNN